MTTGTRFKLDSIECPTCGLNNFSTEHALKVHHSMKHNVKLPNLICENCSEKFYNRTGRKFCDDCSDDLYSCPSCSEKYVKERRKNIHHKLKHGSSISTSRVVCKDCDTKHEYNRDKKTIECKCGVQIDLTRDYMSSNIEPEPCPVCREEFINMGRHWMSTRCEYPELSERQKEMLKGILMSDGSMQFGENNNLKLTLTEYEFLEWFSDELNCICPNRYPTVHRTSEEAKKNAVDYFGEEEVDMDSEYKEQYLLLTKSHLFLNEFDNWYNPQKRYPLDELELTPTMAKMWYCGDGCLATHHSGERAGISCKNEKDRIDDVADLIRDKGFNVYVKSAV